MAAETFLTGQAPHSPTKEDAPPLAASPRLSVADGLRLLRTPSSEGGVQAYHRALEGARPAPAQLLAELGALREGRSTRFELLAEIAMSPKSRERGVGGPGLLLIRLARRAFLASGAATRVRRGRALIAQAEAPPDAPPAGPSTPAEVTRKLVVLEGALVRLENRVFAQARAGGGAAAIAALEARVAALEAELRARITHEGDAPRP